MIQSKIQRLLEDDFKTSKTISDWHKLFMILKKDVHDFIERNKIIEINEQGVQILYCTQCLKAHMLASARLKGIKKNNFIAMDELMEEQTGHDGYYLDGDELKRIDYMN